MNVASFLRLHTNPSIVVFSKLAKASLIINIPVRFLIVDHSSLSSSKCIPRLVFFVQPEGRELSANCFPNLGMSTSLICKYCVSMAALVFVTIKTGICILFHAEASSIGANPPSFTEPALGPHLLKSFILSVIYNNDPAAPLYCTFITFSRGLYLCESILFYHQTQVIQQLLYFTMIRYTIYKLPLHTVLG